MPLPLVIVAACWTIALAVWGVAALLAKPDVYSQPALEREGFGMLFLAGLLFLIMSFAPDLAPEDGGVAPMFVRLWPLSPPVQWASALIALVGLVLGLWSRVMLGRDWSGRVSLKEDHRLVTGGPYALIRHPIYTALILLVLAVALANRTPMALAAVPLMLLSCWLKLRGEEEMMSEAFPDDYPAYMRRTKRLVPLLV